MKPGQQFWRATYLPYDLPLDLPSETVRLRLHLGALAPQSVVIFDKVEALDPSQVEKEKTQSLTSAAFDLRGLVNIASRCVIQGYPYLSAVARRALTDGATVPLAVFERGLETGGEVIFSFPQPARVEAIRFYQGAPDERQRDRFAAYAKSYLFQGRSAGSEKWDRMLARVQGEGRGGWTVHPVAQTHDPIVALRFVATEGEVGYRTAFPVLGEFEIYAKPSEVADWPAPVPQQTGTAVESKGAVSFEEAAWEPLGLPPATGGASPALPNLKRELMRGVTVEPWMFNWVDWDPANGKLADHPPFRKLVENLKRMNANTVWLFPPDARGSQLPDPLKTMVYPSRVTHGIEKNVLSAMCEGMHAQGIRVIVMWLANIPPFSTEAWQFPLEENSRFPKAKQFENVLYGDFFKEKWGDLMIEALELGADGVAVLPDEYYYKGPNLPLVADNQTDQPMVAAYKKRFGYDAPPPRIEDTRRYRAWVLLQYQGLANLVKGWCERIREKFPEAYRTTNISVTPYSHNLGMEHGLAYDLLGHSAELDGFGTDPYFDTYGEGHWMPAAFVKRMIAAQPIVGRGQRRPVMALKANQWWPTDPAMQQTFHPVWSYAAPVSVVAHGGGGAAFYRCNYLTDDPRYAANAGKAYALLQHLESRGLNETQTPRTVALLESRAGQDWYQLKAQTGLMETIGEKSRGQTVEVERIEGGGTVETTAQSSRAAQCELIRGQVHHKVVMERLFEESVPFNQIYLDHPEDLSVLPDYPLAVLPFPYSIPRESVVALEKAVQKGLKLLIIGRKGETDPLGEPCEEGPLLEALLKKYPRRVQFWEDDLMAMGGHPQWIAKFKKFVDNAVGASLPLRVRRDGDVEVAMRVGKEGQRFVFVINWEERPCNVSLQFPRLSDVRRFDEIAFSDEDPLRVRSRGAFPAAGLQSPLRLRLKGGEVRVLVLELA